MTHSKQLLKALPIPEEDFDASWALEFLEGDEIMQLDLSVKTFDLQTELNKLATSPVVNIEKITQLMSRLRLSTIEDIDRIWSEIN